MIFKDYYNEDVLLRKFYLYTAPFAERKITINTDDEDIVIDRPKTIDEFVEKLMFEFNYKSIASSNEFAKVVYSKENNNFNVVGDKEYTLAFDAVTNLLSIDNGEDGYIGKESIGIEFCSNDKNYSEDMECELTINCRSGNYIINIEGENQEGQLLELLQVYIFNYCETNKVDIMKIFEIAAVFIENFVDEIWLYIDTTIIDDMIFPFVNDTQDIFLFVIADYLMTYHNLPELENKNEEE